MLNEGFVQYTVQHQTKVFCFAIKLLLLILLRYLKTVHLGLAIIFDDFQFTQFMSVIREMVNRVETEQKAKLQQLKQMQEETKYFIHCHA